MLFNSYVFLLLFLPLILIGYFGWNHFGKYQTAKAFLIGMSFWFYGFFRPSYLIILITSILVNYGFHLFFRHSVQKRSERKLVLFIAVALNLGTLGYFKYLDFLLTEINFFSHANIPLMGILLPLGISFFTFQQLGFVIDSYRGEVEPYSFLDYALFVSFFPQLVAGPIVTHSEMIPQFKDLSRKKFNVDHFAQGCIYFILGLSKKLLLADAFGRAVDYAWIAIDSLTLLDVMIISLSFYLQIYFDFSGYSDMAIGLGRMLNIELPVNFNSPFKAITMDDYWKRWHITLTRFFTKYLYIPLGGNRKGTLRTYLNVFLVFLASGIWHGAGTGYIVWGISGGLGIIFCKCFSATLEKIRHRKIGTAFLWLVTLAYVSGFFMFFRAESASLGLHYFSRMLPQVSAGATGILSDIPKVMFDVSGIGLNLYLPQAIFCVFFYVLALFIAVRMPNVREIVSRFKYNAINALGLAVLFMLCFLSLSGVTKYIYFNF